MSLLVLISLVLTGCEPTKVPVGGDDGDGDGYSADEDCDDGDAAIHPDAAEACDGLDNNCDDAVDEGVRGSYWLDEDADGWGADGTEFVTCTAPAGYATQVGDCDDSDANVHPDAVETCNGVDDDCDGTSDNASSSIWYTDADGDTFGDPGTGVETCSPVNGQVTDATDCDDADAAVNPGAEEVCGDYDDDDCDGLDDVGTATDDWHTDDDGDGYGHMYNYTTTCDPDPSWVLDGTDCRPNDDEAFPGAAERCNDDDDNCDRVVDEGMDVDGDGYRNASCDDGDDCDDDDADAWPGNPDDACEDGVDGDCDGTDRPCGFYGEYLYSGSSAAHFYSDDASFYAGLLVEVGDATGDGINDVLASTLYADSYGGGGYLIPGGSTGVDTLDNVGHRFTGTAAVSYGAGRSIGMGDIDGDGVEDVAFGAPYGTNAGMFIELGPITGDRSLTSPDIRITCTASIYCGHGGNIGDITGDGVADAVIGAYLDSTGGYASGAVYLVTGPLDDDADAEDDGHEISGSVASGYLGRFVHVGGDFDGDGIGDFQVAAPYAAGAGGPASGIVYVVFGPGSISSMSSADAELQGPGVSGYLGEGAPMSAGDVNGDGYDDAAVGSYTTAAGSSAGAAFVVYGPMSGGIDLTSADIIVEGATSGQHAGSGVSLGDINGDGQAELLIGSSTESTGAASGGSAFMFLTPTAGSWTTADADAWFTGDVASAALGTSVALEDVDGDGNADAVMGAPSDATGASAGGGVWIEYAAD